MMTNDLLGIRAMCDAFEVTPRTLRFYETKELLSPIRQGTRRLYTRRDRARLTLILRAKQFGFSLEDIRQLLDLYDQPDGRLAQLRRGHEMAEIRLEEMTREKVALETAITELRNEMELAADLLAEAERRSNAA
jgi:DNA-binding transcriptional MerR regulator